MTRQERFGELVERFRRQLAESLGRDQLLLFTAYVAVCELLAEELQQADAGRLRFAAVHLALSDLGVTDPMIERAKDRLKHDHNIVQFSNWRH